MPQIIKNKAAICIVNYKTLDFTKLCLRSIRKFTKYPYEVIVIDNNSADESLEYLKSLKWIRLIERDTTGDVSGGYAHGAALDLGLENCDCEFFVSLHSDTFILKENWLSELIEHFDDDEKMACVGSGKIELTPEWQQWLKKVTDWRTFKRKLLKTPDPIGKYRYYNRTICCLYRTDVLKKEKLSFKPQNTLTSGKQIYFDILDRGYKTFELKPRIMGKYLLHLAHATQVVNPQLFSLRKKTIRKCNRLVQRIFSSGLMQQTINDTSLDE